MPGVLVEQQLHGYKGGHHLLSSSVQLKREDQDQIDRLSDLSGPLDPGQKFDPYLTAYPLPSGEHYVVARTWQDRLASRAGCVLTRSFIYPMRTWLDTPALGAALAGLAPFDKENAKAVSVTLQEGILINSVDESWTNEATEALFLEARQPIVVFGVSETDPVLARLLTALWPGIRRQFAGCGFALAPRRLGGRLFDFLCAPNTSRIRFSDWTGRKLDSDSRNALRHRWTATVAEHIFREPNPGLSDFDGLGLLQSDVSGREGVLRVTLLWNELSEKADSSPMAALGLLDIVRSQEPPIDLALVEPALKRSVLLSEQQNDAFEHFRFLMTMLGKVTDRVVPFSLFRLIYDSARRTASSKLDDAFAFISSADSLGRVLPRILCGAIAAAGAENLTKIDNQFILLRPENKLRLLLSNDAFAAGILSSEQGINGIELAHSLNVALASSDSATRDRAIWHLVPHLSRADQVEILAACLNGASWPEICRSVILLWRGTQFSEPAFDQSLLTAAMAQKAVVKFRGALITLPTAPGSDRLLLKTLNSDADDVLWLIDAESLSVDRRAWLVMQVISRSDDNELARIFQRVKLKQPVFEILRTVAKGAEQLARVLATVGIGSQKDFQEGLALIPGVISSGLKHRLALSLLNWLFGRGSELSQAAAVEALAVCAHALSVMDVVAAATDRTLDADALNRNIGVLSSAPDEFRSPLLRDIDDLCERIIAFNHSFFDLGATTSWAQLISDAGRVNKRAQLRAAGIVLPFALKMKYGPASPLIIVTFPLVHAELADTKSTPTIFTMFFFGDYWDRCDTLRRELVDAFLDSEWPPADLMVAALVTGEVGTIAELVARKANKSYRRALIKDVKRLPAESQTALRGALSSLAPRK